MILKHNATFVILPKAVDLSELALRNLLFKTFTAAVDLDEQFAVKPMLDTVTPDYNLRMVEFFRRAQFLFFAGPKERVKGGRAADGTRVAQFAVIKKLILEAEPSRSVPQALLVEIDAILHAAVTLFRKLPLEFQFEILVRVVLIDVPRSLGTNQDAVLDLPTLADLSSVRAGPAVGRFAVEQGDLTGLFGFGIIVGKAGGGKERKKRQKAIAYASCYGHWIGLSGREY